MKEEAFDEGITPSQEEGSVSPATDDHRSVMSRRGMMRLGGAALLGAVASGCVLPSDVSEPSGSTSSTLPTATLAAVEEPALGGTPPSLPPPIAPGGSYAEYGGPYVIFDLCIRDGACVEVCPVECIVPGMPADEWPWYYVDPETCIACGACVPECPVEAVLPAEALATEYQHAIDLNYSFFIDGPGYSAWEMVS